MISENFKKIIDEYPTAIKESLTGHPVAFHIRNVVTSQIRNDAKIPYEYAITGSPGQGNWAEIPWIAVFDKEVTISAQKGYYIVYLFDAKREGVYLSLNQGYTQFEKKYGIKEGRVKIKESSFALQRRLRSTLSDFSFSEINLNTSNNLGIGYELGHVCGKFYPSSSLPNDSILINDLRNIIGIYRELKGMIGPDLFILEDLSPEEKYDEKVETKKIDEVLQGLAKEELLKILRERLPSDTSIQYVEFKGKKIKRNVWLAELVKAKNDYKCQICDFNFTKKDGTFYVEAAHIKPLSSCKMDTEENMIALCPNHHKMLDKGNLELKKSIFSTYIS